MDTVPNQPSLKVTRAFNAVLLTYYLFLQLGETLTEPKSMVPSRWDTLFAGHLDLSILVLLACFVVLIFVGAALFREFWNRLIADLFRTRSLSYQEALALMLIVWILKA